MKQIANNKDDSSIEREIVGTNMMRVQESVRPPNPMLLARVEAAIKEQPEFGVLRAKLLEHGGTEVVPPFGWNSDLRQSVVVRDPDLLALVDRGFLMAGPVVCRSRGMESNQCHENVARLWLQKRKRDALVGIATGYCLGDDLWRQHSWGIRKDSLLETLGEREKYFGIRLEGIDADVFAFKALGEDQSNWPLFSAELVKRVQTELEERVGVTQEMNETKESAQPMCPMTMDHPRWGEFVHRLDGPEGCKFRLAVPNDEKSTTWTCDSTRACPLSRRILSEMGLTVDEILESFLYFRENGGYCDCEILFNVDRQ